MSDFCRHAVLLEPVEHFALLLPLVHFQAIRAAVVAARLPLRGKLRALTITLFMNQRLLGVMLSLAGTLPYTVWDGDARKQKS